MKTIHIFIHGKYGESTIKPFQLFPDRTYVSRSSWFSTLNKLVLYFPIKMELIQA